MHYKIIIQKVEKNPNFEKEIEEVAKRESELRLGGYRPYEQRDLIRPIEYVEQNCLMVQLTEAEYKKVKSEVIKIYE